MTTLIGPQNSIGLMAVLCGVVAFAIWLEQKYVWASKLSGCIIVLLTTLVLSNLKIIPEDAPVYGFVASYLVPISIPLLLFTADIRTIARDSGRVLILFLLSAVGTVIGSLIAYLVMNRFIEGIAVFMAMITASYVGGGINFVAMADTYGASGTMVSTANVADAITMMFFFFALMAIPSMEFFQKRFRHPLVKAQQALKDDGVTADTTNAAAYWSGKEISLKDIALAIGIATAIVGVATPLADFLGGRIPTGNFFLNFMNALLGSKYLLITVITVLVATAFPEQISGVHGAQEIGTYFIYLFFAIMSAPVAIRLLVQDAPKYFICCFIIVFTNLIITLIATKVLKYGIEDAVICSNANVGGATTAAAMAIAKGWPSLVVPAILVGTLGNVIGNIAGIFVGTLLGL
jgi:uncharacterized membrane protein